MLVKLKNIKMMRYSVQPWDQIFSKGYRFLFFARNIGKNISNSSSGKYSQELLDQAKQFAIDALKTTLKSAIQKTAQAIGDLICNKTAARIPKISKPLT